MGASSKIIRPVDYDIPAGLGLDMSETPEWDKDDLAYHPKEVDACDILIFCTSVWLGEKSSVANRTLERMYGYTHQFNSKGQYRDYGKVGATLITGNEDGVKHCAMNILFSLSHIGYTIPPQADAGWMGEAGPGPSYMDEGSGGPQNDFTNRNTTFLVWNCLHLARMLKIREEFQPTETCRMNGMLVVLQEWPAQNINVKLNFLLKPFAHFKFTTKQNC